LTFKQSSIATVKLFGNLFLGHLRQVEGATGEVVVECLEADYGEDDIVDAVEMATVSGFLLRLIRPSLVAAGTQNRGEPLPAQHAGRGRVPCRYGAGAGRRSVLATGTHTTRVPGLLVVPALGPWRQPISLVRAGTAGL
jgi:hypothetical protein